MKGKHMKLGNEIIVATNFIKSHPAIPIMEGEDMQALIYHIEIGYNVNEELQTRNYIIIDYKEYKLSEGKRCDFLNMAKKYCSLKNISEKDTDIVLLDNDEAENFLEKVLSNMKVIKGLITQENEGC
ncbi:MAG: hypothetical protein LBR30_06650 [Clostridioides sp.]|nr:hypothetical protein [Clostridioides sp.]